MLKHHQARAFPGLTLRSNTNQIEQNHILHVSIASTL